MNQLLFPIMLCVTTMTFPMMADAQTASSYRGVTLGDSVAVVVDHLDATLSDVRVVHERPSLIQQLTWHPQRFISGSRVEPDPLAELVLTFHLDRLVLIAVTYDIDKTRGLTNADLLDVFGSTYGTSMLLPTTVVVPAEPTVIGRWSDSEAAVLLWREIYPNRIALTIASIEADAALREAKAAGVRLDAREAPARDLARRAAEEAARQQRDDKVRKDNKAAFKP